MGRLGFMRAVLASQCKNISIWSLIRTKKSGFAHNVGVKKNSEWEIKGILLKKLTKIWTYPQMKLFLTNRKKSRFKTRKIKNLNKNLIFQILLNHKKTILIIFKRQLGVKDWGNASLVKFKIQIRLLRNKKVKTWQTLTINRLDKVAKLDKMFKIKPKWAKI